MSDQTTFEYLRGYSEEEGARLFLQIFTSDTHLVVELDENELTNLRTTLNQPPTEFDAEGYGD